MPAMDSCNIVEFPVATMEFSLATFILQQIITTTLPTYDLAFDYTIPCSCKEGYCESPVETPCTDMREAMTVLDCPPFRSMSTLLRAFARDLAGAHDVFAYDRTVRMNLLYVLGVTVLAGVLNLLFKNTPAMPTSIHLVVALLFPPLLWSPVFVARHTQGRRLIEYGLDLNMKAFVGAVVAAMFLLVWPWSSNSVAESIFEAYAPTSEELLFRGFVIGELRRLFKNSRRENIWAAIVSSIIFAAGHTHHGLKQMILRMLGVSLLFRIHRSVGGLHTATHSNTLRNSRRKTVCPFRLRHMARSMSLVTCE